MKHARMCTHQCLPYACALALLGALARCWCLRAQAEAKLRRARSGVYFPKKSLSGWPVAHDGRPEQLGLSAVAVRQAAPFWRVLWLCAALTAVAAALLGLGCLLLGCWCWVRVRGCGGDHWSQPTAERRDNPEHRLHLRINPASSPARGATLQLRLQPGGAPAARGSARCCNARPLGCAPA
eukprot:scaffold7016_cov123-Isochrysis_galbana.AAC.9